MRAAFGDSAIFEHHDAVCVARGRKTMGYHEGGPASHQALQRIEDLPFGIRIQRAGRLIQNQHRSILQKGASNGQPLAFAAGQGSAALADEGVQSGGADS